MEEDDFDFKVIPIETDRQALQLISTLFQTKDKAEKDRVKTRLRLGICADLTKRLINIISQPKTSIQIKKRITKFMAIFSQDMKQRNCDSAQNYDLLFYLILSDIDQSTRELLKNIFAQIQENQYWEQYNSLKQKLSQILETIKPEEIDIRKFKTYIYLYKLDRSFSDSSETEYFFCNKLIELFPQAVENAIKGKEQITEEEFKKQNKDICSAIKCTIDFLKECFTEMLDHGLYSQQFQQGKQYLVLFNKDKTIFSHVPPCPYSKANNLLTEQTPKCTSEICLALSQIKEIILNSLLRLYKHGIPRQIFEIALQRLLKVDLYLENFQFQSLMSRILMMFQNNLQEYLQYLHERQTKINFISSLLLLSVTPDSTIATIQTNPEKFIEQTDKCFIQPQNQYFGHGNLQASAFATLKIFLISLQIVQQIVIDLLALLIDSIAQNAQSMMKNIQQESPIQHYKKFQFYKLHSHKKIESLLLLITVIYNSGIMQEKYIVHKIVKFIENNFSLLMNHQSPVVILRFIRMLSYFNSPQYFKIIQLQMERGKAFTLQGIKFIIRNLEQQDSILTRYVQFNFEIILNYLQIGSRQQRFLLVNMHQKIIKGNYQANMAILSKIKQQFSSLQATSKRLSCINTFQWLISQQNDPTILSPLLQGFFEFYDTNVKSDRVKLSEEKLIEIYINIIAKTEKIETPFQQLARKSILNLKDNSSSIFFRFYNAYFTRANLTSSEIQALYVSFLQEIRIRLPPLKPSKDTPNIEVVIKYAFLMSQIITLQPNICIKDNRMLTLFYLTKYVPQKYKQYIIGIILTFAYVEPEQFMEFLKQYPICRVYLTNVLRINMNEQIIVKIYNLACCKILEIDEDMVLGEKAIAKFMENMNDIAIRLNVKDKNPKSKDNKLSFLHQNQTSKTVQHHLNNHFKNFKHPLQDIDQFEEFKNMYAVKWQMIERKLSLKQVYQLKQCIRSEASAQTIQEIDVEEDLE